MSLPIEKEIDRMFVLISEREQKNNTRLSKRMAKVRQLLAHVRLALKKAVIKKKRCLYEPSK